MHCERSGQLINRRAVKAAKQRLKAGLGRGLQNGQKPIRFAQDQRREIG